MTHLEDYLAKLTLFDDPSQWFSRMTEEFRKTMNLDIFKIYEVMAVLQLTLKDYLQERRDKIYSNHSLYVI